MLGFGVPLILHSASFFVKGQVDRLFIYQEYTQSQLGLYAMGAKLGLIISVLVLAVNKAVVPYFYEALKSNKIALKNIYNWVLISLFFIPICLLVVLSIPENLFLWILGNDFVGVKYYTLLFVFSSLLVIPYLLMVNYLFYYGKTKEIAMCSVFLAAVYFIALLLFVKIDIKYVPYASIIGAVAILPILYIMTKKVEKKRLEQ